MTVAIVFAVLGLPFSLAAQKTTSPQTAISFDIGAVPLSEALAAFSKATGMQVFADGDLLRNRVSDGVHGVLLPRTALSVLLTPAGLTFEDLAPNTVSVIALPAKLDYNLYYGAIQTRLLNQLCMERDLIAGLERILVRASIGADGTVHSVAVLNVTPESSKGDALAESLSGLRLPPPPSGMPQPVTLVLKPSVSPNGILCETAE